MNDHEISALAVEANAIAMEISAKLADLAYDFDDGTGPEWIFRLSDLANKCKAAGLQTTADRLEKLARSVASRSD